jgi:hypothetical protein
MSDSDGELSVPEGWSLEDVSLPDTEEAEPAEEHDGPLCPVCREHTEEESLVAQGLVLEGIRAMLDQDDQKIKDIGACLTPYDGHVAITMATLYMQDLSMITGVPLDFVLNRYREFINAAQAEGE